MKKLSLFILFFIYMLPVMAGLNLHQTKHAFRQLIVVSPDGRMISKFSGKNSKAVQLSFDSGSHWNTFLTLSNPFQVISLTPDNRTIYFGGFQHDARSNIFNPRLIDLLQERPVLAQADIDSIFTSRIDGTVYLAGQDSKYGTGWLFKSFVDKKDPNQKNWLVEEIGYCTPNYWDILNVNGISGNQDNLYLASTTLDPNARGICIKKTQHGYWNMSKNFPQSNASAVFATQNKMVYAAGYDEDEKHSTLYLTKNAGVTWTKLSFKNPSDNFITSISGSTDGRFIYIGTESSHENSAGLWIKMNDQFKKIRLPENQACNVYNVSSSDSGQIVAISCENGAYWMSRDYGVNWFAIREKI